MHLNGTVCQFLKRTVVLVVLIGGFWSVGCERRQQSAPPPVPEVATVTVQPQKVVLTTVLPGRTSAFRIAEIRPQVSGLIQKRLFTEGSMVKAGQVLYQIDPAPFQAALDNAKAALGKAEANLPAIRLRAERYRELLADKAVSQQEYDDAAAALKQAKAEIEYWKAQVRTARINLGYCRVNAPITGRIGKSNVTEGAIVTAYQPQPLATIQQLDPVYVDVPQSTTELLRLKRRLEKGHLNPDGKKQKKVGLLLEDGAKFPLEGTLQFRDITVDPTTGSVILRIIFPNPEGVLLPGMFVRAVIKEGVNEQALLVPQQAVSRDRKGNPFALLVDAEGKVKQRMLTLDRAIGDQWLVASGLIPGEQVIVEGIQRVRPGVAVKAVPFEPGRKEGLKPENAAPPSAKSN
ncbi:MAG: efflux RND transporter periplasmic adaptor subunit [Deltaproteobacteria bacterium]|nr:efflux RND transporter periplasmic adaptor subunit [Deltaproteobacteria bacterium]MBW1987842.1 efflux RND transporter periplasmic adaptor subunit [Deltaproteobacteria bacterium]